MREIKPRAACSTCLCVCSSARGGSNSRPTEFAFSAVGAFLFSDLCSLLSLSLSLPFRFAERAMKQSSHPADTEGRGNPSSDYIPIPVSLFSFSGREKKNFPVSKSTDVRFLFVVCVYIGRAG